jgi:hypothetical protein
VKKDMKIPVHIVEQGGEMLELNIDKAKKLEKHSTKRIALEKTIQLNMLNTSKFLEGYLPEKETTYNGYKLDYDYLTRKVIPNVEANSNKVNLDFNLAIAVLRETNLLIMELKEEKHYIEKLKDTLVLIERGEYRDWLHGDEEEMK